MQLRGPDQSIINQSLITGVKVGVRGYTGASQMIGSPRKIMKKEI